MRVRLANVTRIGDYMLYRFTDLDSGSVSATLNQSVPHGLIPGKNLSSQQLTLSVVNTPEAIKAMGKVSDPTVRQMARLMQNAAR